MKRASLLRLAAAIAQAEATEAARAPLGNTPSTQSGESASAPVQPSALQAAIRKIEALQEWRANIDGKSMVTDTDGGWLERAAVLAILWDVQEGK